MKTFFKSLGGLIVLCILGAGIFLFFASSRLPNRIASYLSQTLKVGVEIGDIHFSLNKIKVDNFVVGNPPGYKLKKAFSIEDTEILAPVSRYLHDAIVIDEIDMNNVYIGLEFQSIKSTEGNWTTIMSNAQSAQTKSAASASKKTVLIKKLVLKNIKVDLLYQSDGKVRQLRTIPQIVLTNISSQGGNLTDQLMNSALGEAVKEVFVQENLKDVLNKIFQLPSGNPSDVLNGIKGLFN
jgi:hypothetical protein